MSLTQRLTNIGRNALYTGATLTALVAIQHGCQPAYTPEKPQPQNYFQEQEYSVEGFKTALGDRYVPKKAKELENAWNDGDERIRNEIYRIYKNKEDSQVFKGIKNNPKIRKAYVDFNPKTLNPKEAKEIAETVPWKILLDANGSESDKLMLFLLTNKWVLNEY